MLRQDRMMKPKTRAITQVLLKRRRAAHSSLSKGVEYLIINHTIEYAELCHRAGNPCHPQSAGKYLTELAAWCQEKGWPPLNALAVQQVRDKSKRTPGAQYDEAPGCDLRRWKDQLLSCIAFEGYPEEV